MIFRNLGAGFQHPFGDLPRFRGSGEGELLGKIHLPETVANLTFGGQQRNRLYICASTSLYAVYTSAQGALKP